MEESAARIECGNPSYAVPISAFALFPLKRMKRRGMAARTAKAALATCERNGKPRALSDRRLL